MTSQNDSNSNEISIETIREELVSINYYQARILNKLIFLL